MRVLGTTRLEREAREYVGVHLVDGTLGESAEDSTRLWQPVLPAVDLQRLAVHLALTLDTARSGDDVVGGKSRIWRVLCEPTHGRGPRRPERNVRGHDDRRRQSAYRRPNLHRTIVVDKRVVARGAAAGSAAGYRLRMSVTAIVNPIKVDDLGALVARLEVAADQYGFTGLSYVTTTVDDLGTEAARAAVAKGAELVIAVGGDGTVRAVATGLLNSGVSLGVLGRGTGNLFARNLQIPLESTAAIAAAFGGRDRPVDVIDLALGKGRHEISLVMAGMGWDASMMAVSEGAKARLGWGAYALQAARTVRDHPIRLRVQVDDEGEYTFFARTCLIANVGTLVGGLELLPESRPDDGLLEVMVFEPTTSVDYVRSSWGVVRGQSNDLDPARTLLRGRKVVVTTPGSRPRQVDGDVVDEGHGFVARVLPGALTVRVP